MANVIEEYNNDINFDLINKNTFVICKTDMEAIKLIKSLHKLGYKWNDGKPLVKDSGYIPMNNFHGSDTYFRINKCHKEVEVGECVYLRLYEDRQVIFYKDIAIKR